MVKKTVAVVLSVALGAACLAMAVFPLPSAHAAEAGEVCCVWEDGAERISYAEAYAALEGIGEDGLIRLSRNGKTGTVEGSEAFAEAVGILRAGSLFDLYTLDMGALDKLEHAAVFREYGRDIFYSDGAFAIAGDGVRLAEPQGVRCVHLLDGALPKDYLAQSGAASLVLCAEAEFTADRLQNSAVGQIRAYAPYASEGGAVFRDTAGGRRLVAALPLLSSLTVGDCDFADRGALASSRALERLTLPFLGSAKRGGSDLDGSLRWLFQTGDEAPMPETLVFVSVTGGEISDYAFYGCHLSEVVLCGVGEVSRYAFAGADVGRIHAPRADLILAGRYRSTEAPCGCTIYTKEEAE